MVEKNLRRLYLALLYVFLYAPIVVLIAFSFNETKSMGAWTGFSLKWYDALFQDRTIMKALYYTLLVAVTSALVSTVLGTAAAYGIFRMRPWHRKIMLQVNNIPILNPDIVTGVALMSLFIFVKLQLGFTTMLLAHITFNTPFVILSVLPKLSQLPKDIVEAAMDLGATGRVAFFKVILPEIMPGVITGALIAFTMSVDDFVISFFTTGSGVSNLSITIYAMAKRGINPKINALSALMFLAVLVLLLIVNKRQSIIHERSSASNE